MIKHQANLSFVPGVMSLPALFRSSCGVILRRGREPRLAQRFDLCGGLHAAIRDDLLDHSQPCLNSLDVRCVLGGFFGSLAGDELTHFFFVQEPPLERAHRNSAQDRNPDDDNEEYEK
jgi:hypothetical protein